MQEKILEVLHSFIDMNKMLELREFTINLQCLKYDKIIYIEKLKNRYGDKNKFVHQYVMVTFEEEKFRVQISCEIDDDRRLQNKLAEVFKNYNGNFRYLLGGCAFIFYFKEPEELSNLLGEVI